MEGMEYSSLAPPVGAVWVSAEEQWQMKLLLSIRNSEDYLNEKKTFIVSYYNLSTPHIHYKLFLQTSTYG